MLIVVLVLIGIRLALPYVILHYANRRLAGMHEYRGRIKDIDLALLRGAYKIDSVYMNRVNEETGEETPLFSARTIDLSIEWKSILNGSLVGEMELKEPVLRFTKEQAEPDDLRADSSHFKHLFKEFVPLKINRLEVINGKLVFVDPYATPKVDVEMTSVYLVALNLRNSYDSSVLLPAAIRGNASVYDGTLSYDVRLDPLAELPTFDLSAEWTGTRLVELNDFLEAYAKVDVSGGTFGLFTEVAAKDGRYKGYVKPMINDLKVLGKEDREDNPLRKLWEGITGGLGEVLENQPHDRIATKIPIEGSFDDPGVNVWYAIFQVLENAFIQALQPSIDHEISIRSLNKEQDGKNVLKDIFGGEKRQKKQ